MIPPEVNFVGVLPDVKGRVLEGFRLEGYVYQGALESRCHVAYWRMEGQWWRTFVDGPMLYILRWDQEPASWDAGPEYLYPVEEAAQECCGAALERLDISTRNSVPSLRLVLMDGWSIECFGQNSRNSWTTAVLHSPDSSVTPL